MQIPIAQLPDFGQFLSAPLSVGPLEFGELVIASPTVKVGQGSKCQYGEVLEVGDLEEMWVK